MIIEAVLMTLNFFTPKCHDPKWRQPVAVLALAQVRGKAIGPDERKWIEFKAHLKEWAQIQHRTKYQKYIYRGSYPELKFGALVFFQTASDIEAWKANPTFFDEASYGTYDWFEDWTPEVKVPTPARYLLEKANARSKIKIKLDTMTIDN